MQGKSMFTSTLYVPKLKMVFRESVPKTFGVNLSLGFLDEQFRKWKNPETYKM